MPGEATIFYQGQAREHFEVPPGGWFVIGDTAEAFIGDSVVRVFGSIDVGVSLGDADVRGVRLRVASKPGGFGTPNTLVDLVTR